MSDQRAQALRRITAGGGDGEAEAELLAIELRAGLVLESRGDLEARPVRAAAAAAGHRIRWHAHLGAGYSVLAEASWLHEAWAHHLLTWAN